MPSAGRIFAFFCSERDHKPQNSRCSHTAQHFHTAWVNSGGNQCIRIRSAPPHSPDFGGARQHFRFVPKPDERTAAKTRRGRDASYLAPPAQIRTCSFPAYGSHLGYPRQLPGGLLGLTWAGLAPADRASFAGAFLYSITSSARPSRVIGNVRPNALAVFMLMMSSTLPCWTGRSTDFSPLRIRAMLIPANRHESVILPP
jgi:hypothetical protein